VPSAGGLPQTLGEHAPVERPIGNCCCSHTWLCSFSGAAALGDPCTFTTPPGEAGCAVIFSPLQQDIGNAGFGGVCLLIGFIGGLLTRSYRLIAGALSTLAAVFLSHFAGHWIYSIGWPQHPLPWTSSTILTTSGFMAAFAAIGLIGAALSPHVRLTNAWSGREG
jgi:hypothetical protein